MVEGLKGFGRGGSRRSPAGGAPSPRATPVGGAIGRLHLLDQRAPEEKVAPRGAGHRAQREAQQDSTTRVLSVPGSAARRSVAARRAFGQRSQAHALAPAQADTAGVEPVEQGAAAAQAGTARRRSASRRPRSASGMRESLRRVFPDVPQHRRPDRARKERCRRPCRAGPGRRPGCRRPGRAPVLARGPRPGQQRLVLMRNRELRALAHVPDDRRVHRGEGRGLTPGQRTPPAFGSPPPGPLPSAAAAAFTSYRS